MQQNFDYEKSAVIRPPPEDVQALSRFTRVVVDSKDRNMELFPTPTQYEVPLEDDIEDVIGAEIVIADVPFSSYLVNQYNNTFILSSIYTISIPHGDYTPVSLSQIVAQVMNDAQTEQTFQVTYDSITDKFTISSNMPFSLEFGENNTYMKNGFGRMFGFGPNTYVANNLNTIIAPYRKNFTHANYIIMHIDQMSVNNSVNNATHKSFAVLQRNYTQLNIYTPLTIKKTFNPPIGRLSKLRISFKDYDGNPYDFQNYEHRLDILFESRKHLRRYMM